MRQWTPCWKIVNITKPKQTGTITWLISGFIIILTSLVITSLLLIIIYRWVSPCPTWLMAQRFFFHETTRFEPINHRWMPIDSISLDIIHAVIASEDNLFLAHKGFDYESIRRAREEIKQGKRFRGASTISMQTAKNVFLWPKRSWARKGLEAVFTWAIERAWGKRRIMEVYLNVIELGSGVYGVEAASQHFFMKQAMYINREQAALMATVLPNPLSRDLSSPSSFMYRSQQRVLRSMRNIGPLPVEIFHTRQVNPTK